MSITPPQGGTAGKLLIVAPKAKLLEEVRKAIPESFSIPDQNLGNVRVGDVVIYRDVQLSNVKAADLKPTSLTLDRDNFHFAGSPTVSGSLNALYEHVVVTWEVRKVGRVLGRDIKTSVPVTRRDWRPKGAAPFFVRIEVRGTCKVSFPEAVSLKDARLRFETQTNFVRIQDVKLQSSDPVYVVARELIGVAGRAFPNEGVNKPIKDWLTRQFVLDPFEKLPAKDREELGQFSVNGITVKTNETEVRITAELTAR